MRCLNITILEDTDVECDQDFTVGIQSIIPDVSDDLPSSITVSIDDGGDGKPAECQIQVPQWGVFPLHFCCCAFIMVW